MKNKVVILGIDSFLKKNIYQLNCLRNKGFELIVFTNDIMGSSRYLYENCFLLEKKFIKRIVQIFKYLIENKNYIHHVEIYPGGRFALFYLIISKFLGIKSITVERGDLIYWNKYNKLFQFSLKLLYKYSNLVWYKEPYMKKLLENFGIQKKFFLHNCISIDNNSTINIPNFEDRNIDFLWVNRFIEARKIEWVLELAKKLPNKKFVCVGYLEKPFSKDVEEKQNYINEFLRKHKLTNISILDYQDPYQYYINSKFFLLPSDIVFLNHALLEAMYFGCIPIISKVEGSDLIINDGINGFVFEHNYNSFEEKIIQIIKNPNINFNLISKNAIKSVEENFSCEKWCENYITMIYKEI